MRNLLLGLLAAVILAVTAGTAFADDWTVTRLRGTVEQMVGGQWQPLERGGVVPDERKIFTRANGHATLVRGNEAIELGPNTQIEIYDKGGRKPFTTVLQYAGVLTVEAEVRNVQHFAVRTTYLAAVVKGTRFTVTARSTGGSVEVLRGQVSVENEQNDETVLIVAGQKAKVAKGGDLTVSGKPKAGTQPPAAAEGSAAQASAVRTETDVAGSDDAGQGNSGGAATDSNSASTDNTPKPGKTTDKVAKVVDKATDKVEKVVDQTTDKVAKVVDKTADKVEKVVDKTTNTVGAVTGGLTGLLGKKPK